MPRVRLKQLAQDGATDGQVASWDNAAGEWQPTTVAAGDPGATDTTATGSTTSSSTSYVTVSGMTVTPASGTYLVFFTGTVANDTDSSTSWAAIFSAGTLVASSERVLGGAAAKIKTAGIGFCCVAKVTVNGSQAITGRWKRDVGTMTMEARSLTILEVS